MTPVVKQGYLCDHQIRAMRWIPVGSSVSTQRREHSWGNCSPFSESCLLIGWRWELSPDEASIPRCHLQPSFFLFSLRQSFTKLPRLALDSLWNPCWLWTFDPLFFTYRTLLYWWYVPACPDLRLLSIFFVCLNSFNYSWLFEERFFCWVRQKEESQPQLISDIC